MVAAGIDTVDVFVFPIQSMIPTGVGMVGNDTVLSRLHSRDNAD
jgi:hypothetical protein